ncbi:MAG: alpha/beta hydrolase [Pseudomonadales bacterium]
MPSDLPLPGGIRCRSVAAVNGLDVHLLESGSAGDPCILLLHGFPDLAFGWRRVIGPLADAGYRVIAPDLRGYGRTTGWRPEYDADLRPFGMLNLVKDLVALLQALEIDRVHCLVGHDFGSPLAAYTALLRPDLIERLVLMSAPFAGAPGLAAPGFDMDAALRALSPPRKHYQTYYREPQANADLLGAPHGLANFLRAYFHVKSADWTDNRPFPLSAWTAEQLALLPAYYLMHADRTMPETVAAAMPEKPSSWLSDAELEVYAAEYARTGFQGGLNWYRASHDATLRAELAVLFGKPIPIPCWFISGVADWGNHQTPLALERLERRAAADYCGTRFLAGAGHWVQQEQAQATINLLLDVAATTP